MQDVHMNSVFLVKVIKLSQTQDDATQQWADTPLTLSSPSTVT